MAEITITKDEAESLLDWLEINLIDDIRNDTDCDSMGKAEAVCCRCFS